jgi:hypothetical protein
MRSERAAVRAWRTRKARPAAKVATMNGSGVTVLTTYRVDAGIARAVAAVSTELLSGASSSRPATTSASPARMNSGRLTNRIRRSPCHGRIAASWKRLPLAG